MPKATKRKYDLSQKVVSDREDDVGKIQITIILKEGQTNKKGNLTKTITLQEGRVSEVYEDIINALS